MAWADDPAELRVHRFRYGASARVVLMGRPLGSKNKSTREFRAVVAALDRSGEIDLRGLVLALYHDATSPDDKVRLPARRELLSRVYGLPRQELAVEHGVGVSVVALLEQIGRSESHRRRLEEREARQLAAAAITVEPEEKPQ
jgi:hypothetical protein